ncbi:cytosolic leucyl tRNA synthetase [Tilletia horrida]|uniref:leucine--tRNA ligase n=1 Tax=Tilletia horrida TaxID=155126 RepID=A0AAN6JUN9_9BASI|nr:cytosolic leucyl tRNA synthetase [Tilletia horrida]KAK0569550.1 cytosolic leucyl tRNA synthetase [Tilletia horrida]
MATAAAKAAPAPATGAGPTSAQVAANGGPIQLENTTKRDFLRDLEKKYQEFWEESKFFQVDAPTNEERFKDLTPEQVREQIPKFFGNIPYPYMNGLLHLGHAFTVSKVEFATGYERLKGKRALFPWAFHLTGMPIRATTDKLIREVELFGKDFSGYKEEEAEAAPEPKPTQATTSVTTSNVEKATKGKLQAKSTGHKYQFQILRAGGVPMDQIHEFTDTKKWMQYFPPLAKSTCHQFGARIDWRRAFFTTDANPYYDAFVRWQMNKLHAMQKIKFGERYTIYSIKDGQPCMDHDRSEGEALGPQEYTALKLKLIQWAPAAKAALEAKAGVLDGSRDVFFVAATLRPETMYGQTNCFVGPAISYGLYAINDKEIYLCTERAARNMAYQGTMSERGKVELLAEIKGSDLIGSKVKAPFAIHDEVYILPMETVLATKGTGVVTSVPSDSPDDYATLMDLRKKAEFYKIDPAWAALDPIPVLETPTYGNMTAEVLVKQLKINSPKDKNQLAEAKELAYKEGFYSGTMIVGDYKGQSVQDAKPKVREDMIKAGLAFAYAEPEGKIVSRSGDDCIVALFDQWYLDYGEAAWKEQAQKLVAQMNLYNAETRNGFEGVLAWLHQWACARSYGLGTKLPWDPQFLVESLSDSTIYMAYYTIAHFLQGGVEDGSKGSPLGIKVEDCTDEFFDFVFLGGQWPQSSSISKEVGERLVREFRYFYPMDVRSSGKDLIPNHLTFCIYNHAALFPEEHWPRSMRINGHLMLNGKKMSKSTGNSLSMQDSVEKFGADATRISLADAGDGIEDANFEEKTANANILRLHTLIEWCEETVKNKAELRTGPKDNFWDKVFENEINSFIQITDECYGNAMYKDAMKFGFYELQTSRDLYREATADVKMHVDLVLLWIRTQALLVAPVAPHFAEHLFRTVLGESGSVQTASWPALTHPVDKTITDTAAYVRGKTKTIRDAEIQLAKKKAKGKDVGVKYEERKPKDLRIFVAKNFPAWQEAIVKVVKENTNEKGVTDDAKVRETLAAQGMLKDKKAMPFVIALKKRISESGADVAFNRMLPFNEIETLQAASSYIKRTMGFREIHIESAEDALSKADELEGKDGFDRKIVEAAEPGTPSFTFYNV